MEANFEKEMPSIWKSSNWAGPNSTDRLLTREETPLGLFWGNLRKETPSNSWLRLLTGDTTPLGQEQPPNELEGNFSDPKGLADEGKRQSEELKGRIEESTERPRDQRKATGDKGEEESSKALSKVWPLTIENGVEVYTWAYHLQWRAPPLTLTPLGPSPKQGLETPYASSIDPRAFDCLDLSIRDKLWLSLPKKIFAFEESSLSWKQFSALATTLPSKELGGFSRKGVGGKLLTQLLPNFLSRLTWGFDTWREELRYLGRETFSELPML